MNGIEVHSELDKLCAQMTALETERAGYVDRRDRALAAEPHLFDQNHVNGAKREVARVQQQIDNVQERIAALASQLPTAVSVRAASSDARALSDDAEIARSNFNTAWTELVAQVETAVGTARAVARAAEAARSASRSVRELNSRFALDVPVPEQPSPDVNEIEIVGTFATRILSDVAYHQILDVELNTGLNAKLAERNRRREEPLAV